MHILPQNNHRRPLHKSANIGWYSRWKHCWKIFAERSHTASEKISSAHWNRCPRSFCFKQRENKTAQCRISQVWTMWQNGDPLLCHLPLDRYRVLCGGCCHMGNASSSCAKAQDAYHELNYANSVEPPCSCTMLRSLFLGCCSSSFLAKMAISKCSIVISVVDHRGNGCFSPCYDRLSHCKCSCECLAGLATRRVERCAGWHEMWFSYQTDFCDKYDD